MGGAEKLGGATSVGGVWYARDGRPTKCVGGLWVGGAAAVMVDVGGGAPPSITAKLTGCLVYLRGGLAVSGTAAPISPIKKER